MKNIILIHGALGHSLHFDNLSKSLSKDYKVYSLLFKDHGLNNASHEELRIPRLVEELDIPVMHDDQHGTAIISSAALINALELF